MSDFTLRVEVVGMPGKKPAASKMMERICFCAAIGQTLIAAFYAAAARDLWGCLTIFVFAANWWTLGLTYRAHRLKSEKLFCEAIEVARSAFVEFVRRRDEFRP